MKKFLLFLSVMSLAACATARDPSPVSIVNPSDLELACADIHLEYKINTQMAASKISKNFFTDKTESERGCLIWPRLPDFKNAEGIEGNALLHRNVRLRKLAESKDCDIAQYPAQPPHYQ